MRTFYSIALAGVLALGIAACKKPDSGKKKEPERNIDAAVQVEKEWKPGPGIKAIESIEPKRLLDCLKGCVRANYGNVNGYKKYKACKDKCHSDYPFLERRKCISDCEKRPGDEKDDCRRGCYERHPPRTQPLLKI